MYTYPQTRIFSKVRGMTEKFSAHHVLKFYSGFEFLISNSYFTEPQTPNFGNLSSISIEYTSRFTATPMIALYNSDRL